MVSPRTRLMMGRSFARTYDGTLNLYRPGTTIKTELGSKPGAAVKVNASPLKCRSHPVGDEEDLGKVVRENRRINRVYWQGPDRPDVDWTVELFHDDGTPMGVWAVEDVKEARTGAVVEWEALIYQKIKP